MNKIKRRMILSLSIVILMAIMCSACQSQKTQSSAQVAAAAQSGVPQDQIHYVKSSLDAEGSANITQQKISVGNITLGDTQEKVQELYGEPDEQGIVNSTPFPYWRYAKDNLTVQFFRKGDTEPVGGVVSISVDGPSDLKTNQSIGIHSSLDDIIHAYGEVYASVEPKDRWVWLVGKGESEGNPYPQLTFSLEDGRIASIEFNNFLVEPTPHVTAENSNPDVQQDSPIIQTP